VETLLAPFGARVEFVGAIDEGLLRGYYEAADVFVWPGVNEAYGMAYLEAQAAGTPVVAADWPGPRGVIGQPLAARNDPQAFARMITGMGPGAGGAARDYVMDNHALAAAAGRLSGLLGDLL
jgi:glycosyltransferase involved in cell wall biosynthesis